MRSDATFGILTVALVLLFLWIYDHGRWSYIQQAITGPASTPVPSPVPGGYPGTATLPPTLPGPGKSAYTGPGSDIYNSVISGLDAYGAFTSAA